MGAVLQGCIAVRDGYPVPPPVLWLAYLVLCFVLVLVLAAFVRLFRDVPGRVGRWFRRSWLDDLAPVPFVASIVIFSDIDLRPVPLAIMVGCAVHMIGDMITKRGLMLFYPLSRMKFRLAKIKAGGLIERVLIVPLMIAGIVWCVGVLVWGPVSTLIRVVQNWW